MARERVMGIYCIRNILDNKRYIGSGVNLGTRKSRHFRDLIKNDHFNKHLQYAWNKYGEENFVFEILEIIKDKYNLEKRENYYIKLYKSNRREFGYNIREDAHSNVGLVPYNKGKHHTPEAIAKMSMPRPHTQGNKSMWYGKHLPKEMRDKISAANIGVKRAQNTSSKYVGVSLDRYGWNSNITIDRECIFLGHFKTEIEAAMAYNEAAEQFYGWKAKLNSITKEDIDALWNDDVDEKAAEKLTKIMSESKMGIKRGKTTSSKYVGVCQHNKKWITNITIDGEETYIGSFQTETEAAMAYNEIAQEFYGYKARLNVIDAEEIKGMWELSDEDIDGSISGIGIKYRKNTTSKYVGVSLSCGKYWVARIGVFDKRIYLGSFKTEIDAAIAYNEAATKYYGNKANLNLIPQPKSIESGS